MRLINGEKDRKCVSVQLMVILNTCCDVACLTVKLPSQPAFFRATNIWRKTIYLQSDEQVGVRTLRHQDSSAPRHFGTKQLVPKCMQ